MNTAPLYELENFRCPGEAFYFSLNGNNKLRVAFWNLESSKGTIFLQSGRTEFIEKYFEVITEFIDRGYAVAMMDWRGQGLSSRIANDKRIGHIDKFETYDKDLITVINDCFKIKCPPPYIGFGHSMGGCLLTSYLLTEENCLEKCILCAPMLSVRANAVSRRIVKTLGLLDSLGFGAFPMQKPSWDKDIGWKEESFEENALTTDKERFMRTFHLLQRFPELGVKGITVGWLKHALKRTNNFKDIDWNKKLTTPLLLLDATDDKLVNSEINKQLLEKSKLTTVVSIKAQHEIMMEKNEIRTIAWKAIDEFLSP